MRTRGIAAALALGALAAGRAEATVDKVESCGTEWGGASPFLVLARGVANDVTITGFGVDLATSVDTTLPGVTVSVLSRKNGLGSNIVLRFVAPAKGDEVEGVVTLHYLAGQDVVPATLRTGVPTISSIAFVPGPGVSTTGGTTRVTSLDTHVVSIKGSKLDTITPSDLSFGRAKLRNLAIVSRVSGELRFSFTSEAGDRTIDSSLFSSDGYAAHCAPPIPQFVLTFTVFDPPRTPTPTPTPTPTRTATPTATPPKFAPIHVTPGLRPSLPTPTPTPRFRLLPPPSPTPGT